MKPESALAIALASTGAVITVERFYHHPTYGNGLKAFFALVKASFAIE